MKPESKAELKGLVKGVLAAFLVIGIITAIGVVIATVVITDESITIDDNTVLVEGDFTTWTHKWTNALPNGLYDTSFIGFLIDDTNDKLSIAWYDGATGGVHWNRWGVFNLEDFSQVYVSPSGEDYAYEYPEIDFKSSSQLGNVDFSGGVSRSLQSYTCFLRPNGVMEVWRGGSTPLWSHNVSADAGCYYNYGHGGISASGKYILYVAYKDTGNDAWVLLYEGS